MNTQELAIMAALDALVDMVDSVPETESGWLTIADCTDRLAVLFREHAKTKP